VTSGKPNVASTPFTNPPHIRAASDGSYTLNIQERVVTVGGQQLRLQTYTDANNPDDHGAPGGALNRPPVGPTITLTGNGSPVQNVTLNLNNQLPWPATLNPHSSHKTGSGPDNPPQGVSVTNIHTHGLHVAPSQDNVFVELYPHLPSTATQESLGLPATSPFPVVCGTYPYRYAFGQTPGGGTTTLPAGTYWYHPHKHGSVASQVANGMVGAFIVRGDLDTVPGVAGLTEQVMVVQLIEYTDTTPQPQVTNVDPHYLYNGPPAGTTLNSQLTINGQMNPTLAMQFGEIQHWRFVNATYNQFFSLAVQATQGTTAAAPVLYAIATDGVPLTNSSSGLTVPFALATPQNSPTTFADVVMNEVAVLAPGQRLDLLVQVPVSAASTPQAFSLMAMTYPSPSSGATGQRIAQLQVSGVKAPADQLPASSAFNGGALVRPPISLPADPNAHPTQVIAFSFEQNASINGVPFSEAGPQLTLQLNNVDIWNVVGYSAPHAFHIHINSFVIAQRFGVDITSAMIWRDTVRTDQAADPPPPMPPLPAPSTAAAAVQFISQQLDYTGDFVQHCHVLDHEDFGMMWWVRIAS
jgi:FtsP/CotA-like multicopper oxidase with cupredoxin domain